MTDTDLSDWLTVPEAAQRIGCSTRTVERLAKAKKLEQRLKPQDGTPPVAVYNPDDVARIAAERHQAPAPFVLPAVQTNGNGNGHHEPSQAGLTRVTNASADDPIHRFFTEALRYLQVLHASPPSPPVSERLSERRQVLTLDEAAAETGWTRTYLLKKIHSGGLKAEKDRGWKIRRVDLEGL